MSIWGCKVHGFLLMTTSRKRTTSIEFRIHAMVAANNFDNNSLWSTGCDMVKWLVVVIDAFTATTDFLSFFSLETIILSFLNQTLLWHLTHFGNKKEIEEKGEEKWSNGAVECRNNLSVAIDLNWNVKVWSI